MLLLTTLIWIVIFLKSLILTVLVLAIAIISVGQNIQTMSPMENPRIEIKKSQRRLQIFDGEKLIKTYKIAIGFAPNGDKRIEGDGKTPEGKFTFSRRTRKADSIYRSV